MIDDDTMLRLSTLENELDAIRWKSGTLSQEFKTLLRKVERQNEESHIFRRDIMQDIDGLANNVAKSLGFKPKFWHWNDHPALSKIGDFVEKWRKLAYSR